MILIQLDKQIVLSDEVIKKRDPTPPARLCIKHVNHTTNFQKHGNMVVIRSGNSPLKFRSNMIGLKQQKVTCFGNV